MAGIDFTSKSVPVSNKTLSGGLNTTAGPLGLKDNESSDLQNIDFDVFGSIIKRNGYTTANALPTTGEVSDGLHWFEYDAAGTITRKAINIAGGSFKKMDSLDGVWDTIADNGTTVGTGLTITSGNFCDFTNFLNEVYITNGINLPFEWSGSAMATANVMAVPTDLTIAKYNEEFNNYLFLANVKVGGINHPSRIYWSNIKDTNTWTATDFIDVSKNDGQEITRIKKLGDRLVVFKTRSIYNIFFTGDADVPFILPGGGKSNSPVGCIAPFSIQEVENGIVFLSNDGLYFYDGMNAYKISDRITTTLLALNTTRFANAVSTVYKSKNRYLLGLTTSGGATHDRVIVWDYYNNAFSLYVGFEPSAMATFFVSGTSERPYFCDYSGYMYRADTGSDDYPEKTQTAIDAHYYTNWKTYEDLVDKKGVAQVVIYYSIANTILTFAYSYDLDTSDQYTQSLNLSTSSDVYGAGVYGVATYAKAGGNVMRRDLTGRGRVVRFKFANSTLSESFRVDGFGSLPHLETNA